MFDIFTQYAQGGPDYIHGLLTGRMLSDALALGIAHGALAMTTPGDTSAATADDVERLVAGGDTDVIR